MRTVSPRHWCYGVAVCCLLVALSGCRNRGACGGNCFSAGQFANQTTIAPPATYSLNIPGSPNAIAQNNGSGTTNQAPVRQATNTQPITNGVNVQNGWVPAGSTSTTNSTIQGSQSTLPVTNPTLGLNNNQSQRNTRVAQNQTQLINVDPNNRNTVSGSNSRANLASQSNGLSFTEATNFRSTAVDERLDQSRLPVTDASLVRAPTNFSPTTTVGQFNAPYYVPQQQVANANIQGFNNVNNNRIAAVPQYQQQVAPQYQQVAQANNRTNTTVGSFGQPSFAQPTQQPYQGLATQSPQVLAQSTVYADPASDPNLNSAWRDRDLTAGRDQFKR